MPRLAAIRVGKPGLRTSCPRLPDPKTEDAHNSTPLPLCTYYTYTMVSLDVPDSYGYVVLGAGVLPCLTGMFLSGAVMKARKGKRFHRLGPISPAPIPTSVSHCPFLLHCTDYDVQYPNLYAVPKVHKDADAFNRVQRGHQNYLEGADSYAMLTLIGGLKHPLACSIGSVCFCIGSVLYMTGYKDANLDVKTARYKKGGGIKWIGFFTSLISCCKLGYDLIKG